MKRLVALALLLAPLAACGVQGPLDRPAPLFGEARRQYEAEQARLKAEAEARKAAEAQSRGEVAPATPAPAAPPPASPPPAPQ